jgi:hypothetical protein
MLPKWVENRQHFWAEATLLATLLKKSVAYFWEANILIINKLVFQKRQRQHFNTFF